MKYLANAKLNLYLNIVGKNKKNYHLLEMVNVPVDIYDEIEMEFKEASLTCLNQSFFPPIDCAVEKSTIYKAFSVLKKYIAEPISVAVSVKKGIPAGSGMGGGSSDAAFFIKLLCEKFSIKMTQKLIDEISERVGADVPFFLFNKPAFVYGIGEKVSPYHNFPLLYFVVVVPHFSVSTKWAYENFKMALTKNGDDINIKNSKPDLTTLLKVMKNDLEGVVAARYPVIGEIKGFLAEKGALKAMMTGSGSAVYGVFDNLADCEAAYRAARDKFLSYRVYLCKTIGV